MKIDIQNFFFEKCVHLFCHGYKRRQFITRTFSARITAYQLFALFFSTLKTHSSGRNVNFFKTFLQRYFSHQISRVEFIVAMF